MKVVHVAFVLHDLRAEVVGFAIDEAGLDAAARKP
jgi:hypothetical protein